MGEAIFVHDFDTIALEAEKTGDVMSGIGSGFCPSGYYAGWDNSFLSLSECKDACLSDSNCQAISFCPPGSSGCVHESQEGSCSRYNQTCTVMVEDGLHQSFGKVSSTSTVMGDPHVVTSHGFKLDLNQPGEYTLLQVPYSGQPLLRLEATVERSGMTCSFYVTKARFLGAWFHKDIIKIRAGNQDGLPFAIQMADAEPWATLASISNNNETILKTYKHANVEVKVKAAQQTTKGAASHKDPEGSFSVLVAMPGQPQAEQTIIKIAKGEHWLNVALTRLGHLGYSKMGGVLGTDVPNAKWSELPDDCKMFHELQGENFRTKDMAAEFEAGSDASIFWY